MTASLHPQQLSYNKRYHATFKTATPKERDIVDEYNYHKHTLVRVLIEYFLSFQANSESYGDMEGILYQHNLA
jgi:predicted protein tyrosine phosphatase